jgi:predicted HAD superfamily hydrolase
MLLSNGSTLFAALLKGMFDFRRYELVSYDIFDTLFYRRCGGFFKVFEKLEEKTGIDGFAQLRKGTEVRLLMKLQREISLEEIYRALDELLPAHDWEAIRKLELEIEEANLAVSARGRRSLQKARGTGARIVFLSDMYLSERWIQEQLRRHSIWQEGDLLFVSSESGSTKRSGELYEIVKSKFPGLSWKHYGDNLMSDVLSAYRSGITAQWLPHSYFRSINDHLFRLFNRKRWLRRIPEFKG